MSTVQMASRDTPAAPAPLITIGITCYREGDWLLECWESVLAQTDDRWEAVLIMDGGADERTREIFESLAHPKLRKYAMPENRGPYPARNKAFELTRTPYHFYLDADDQLTPDTVALVLRAFARHPDASIVYGDFALFGNMNEIRRFPRERTDEELIKGNHSGPCAYTREIWERLGGFADALSRGAADYDFHLAAAEVGARAYHCGAVYYFYRVRSGSVSGGYRRRLHETFATLIERHPVFFRDRGRRRRLLARAYHVELDLCDPADRRRYLLTALRGAWQGDWRTRDVWVHCARLYLPRPLFAAARGGWRGLKALPQSIRNARRRLLPRSKVKAHDELAFWRQRLSDRGTLSNDHFEFVYTTHFGLDKEFYTGKKLLDVGCGPRGSLEWADIAAETVGLDPLAKSYAELGTDRHRMRYVEGGAEHMPFPDGYFDLVSAFNALDHVDDLPRSIAEIIRVIAPGGLFLLLTEVDHPPTPTEPSVFSWDIVDAFRARMEVIDERHYERSPRGLYQTIRDGQPYDHQNPAPRPGILSVLLRKGEERHT